MLRFELNGRPTEVHDASPNTTLLNWLRAQQLTGTKEGCAEGDCGACTVILLDDRAPSGPRYRAVNSCLLLLPMVHGRKLWTVEGIGSVSDPHPVQSAMVQAMGSQCGYCTPGFVMSLFEACYRDDLDAEWKLDDQLAGNLCRCTGYRPIRDAAIAIGGKRPSDPFAHALTQPPTLPQGLDHTGDGERFVAPTTLAAATRLLAQWPGARLICGATDLGLDVTKKHERFPLLLSTEHIAELGGIEEDAGGWSLGAALTLTDLEDWSADSLPILHRMLRYFGARQIKHRATVGGNLCNASPIGDLAPVLLALGASVVLASEEGSRRVALQDFYLGYRSTALRPGELLSRVEVPRPAPGSRMGSYKVSRRRELDISAVAAGMVLELDGHVITAARLGFGGVAATPTRAPLTEAALVGQVWSEELARSVAPTLEQDFSPIDDHRGSAWFRRTLAQNLLLGFAAETAGGTEFVSLPTGHAATVIPQETR